jgi:hydrogenase maturation protease
LKQTIIIGYGNPDRQDDGVAWHVLCAVAEELGLAAPFTFDDEFPPHPSVDFLFDLQLTPELAETLSGYPRACFVDAHTGAIPREVNVEAIQAEFQKSPFTHHMTPQTLLSMSQALYQRAPEALLVSILGHKFGFTNELSEQTQALVPQAAAEIMQWLKET